MESMRTRHDLIALGAILCLALLLASVILNAGASVTIMDKSEFERGNVIRDDARIRHDDIASSRSNDWTNLTRTVNPPGRYLQSMAYDSKSDRIIMFGGNGLFGDNNETWAYDFNTNIWKQMYPSITPRMRIATAMAYDSESDRIILFGGYSGNETWAYEYNTNTWKNMTPLSQPSASFGPPMAYDSKSDRVIIFAFSGTWTYDYNANTWKNMSPGVNPPHSSTYVMTYDSKCDRVVMFGGMRDLNLYNETWTYDFNTNLWINMKPIISPPARNDFGMVYDSKSDRIILFGGSGYHNDTWAYEFNSNAWTELKPAIRPAGRYGHAMAYDLESDRIILFGGRIMNMIFDDTWAYDYNTNAWTNMTHLLTPKGRFLHSMAYDSKSDRIIMFGGNGLFGYNDETWMYDFNTNAWKQTFPSAKPEPRGASAMAYDSKSDRIILFGGYYYAMGYIYLNDTWAYDFENNTWTNMRPSASPYPRAYHAMVYDSRIDRIILFGGAISSVELVGDIWSYDYITNNWIELQPSIMPNPRCCHALVYDSKSDSIIMFGGYSGSYLSETWAYHASNNTWTNMKPTTSPSPRDTHAMAYDSESDRTILFGGYTEGRAYNDETWMYDFKNNSWTNMDPHPHPLSRFFHAMAYDSESDRIVLFGGDTGFYYNNETWAYELDGSPPPDISPPYVVKTIPSNGKKNVPLATNISIQWSEGMDHPSAEKAFSSSLAISCMWSWNGVNQTCTPTSLLKLDTKYTITLSKSASDISGNGMKNPHTFSFTTLSPPDTDPPYIVATDPKDQDTNVKIAAAISVQWNEEMDRSSAEVAFSSSPMITCAWSWNSLNQTCMPSASFQFNTKYTINISTNARDLAGNAIAKPYTFTFKTEQPPDTTPPIVVGTKPSDGETDVDKTSRITITFSERMNESAVESGVSITPGSIIKEEWDGSGVILILTASLENGTRYTVKISTSAKDLAGNAMKSNYTFSFTTKGTVGFDSIVIVPIIVILILVVLLLLLRKRRKVAHSKDKKSTSQKET